jgi:hypothetical protein
MNLLWRDVTNVRSIAISMITDNVITNIHTIKSKLLSFQNHIIKLTNISFEKTIMLKKITGKMFIPPVIFNKASV